MQVLYYRAFLNHVAQESKYLIACLAIDVVIQMQGKNKTLLLIFHLSLNLNRRSL